MGKTMWREIFEKWMEYRGAGIDDVELVFDFVLYLEMLDNSKLIHNQSERWLKNAGPVRHPSLDLAAQEM